MQSNNIDKVGVACLLYDNVHISKQVQSFSRLISEDEYKKITLDEIDKLAAVSDAAAKKYKHDDHLDVVIQELSEPTSFNIIVHYLCIVQAMVMCIQMNLRNVTIYTRTQRLFHHLQSTTNAATPFTQHLIDIINHMHTQFDQCMFICMMDASVTSPTTMLVLQAAERTHNDDNNATHHFNPLSDYHRLVETLSEAQASPVDSVDPSQTKIKKRSNKVKMVWRKKISVDNNNNNNKKMNDFNNLINVQSNNNNNNDKKKKIKMQNKLWVDTRRLITDNHIMNESI